MTKKTAITFSIGFTFIKSWYVLHDVYIVQLFLDLFIGYFVGIELVRAGMTVTGNPVSYVVLVTGKKT